MKAIKNYYFILGISRNAYPTEIEAAYLSWRAAADYDEFQASMEEEITEAYKCLSDPKLRKEFDESLGTPPQLNTPGGNVHNFRSHESGITVEKEFQKELRKQKFKRRLVKVVVTVLIIFVAASYGIKRWDKYSPKMPSIPVISAFLDMFRKSQ
ncbi:MAG: hypothetical protein FWE55_02740 [Synergistaceae bacterium]|nr:hypothetical protein [Synergistaceae bacterium]